MNRLLRAGAYLILFALLSACGDDSTPPPVNRVPVLGNLSVTLAEDTPVEIDVLGAASDPDGEALTLSTFEEPAHGTVTQSGGVLTYTPEADYNGPDQFGVTVTDGEASVSGTVALTITPVNDGPVAVADLAQVNEAEEAVLDVLANDTDVDGDALTLVGVLAPSHGAADIVDSHLVYTSDDEYAGPDTVRYVVSDGALQDTGTVALVVYAVDDPPTAVADEATGNEDERLTIDVLANDSDPEGDAIVVESFSQGAHGLVVADNPGLAYLPDADWNGTDTFDYIAMDGIGGRDTAVVTVHILPVADRPQANPDTIAIGEGGTALFDPLTNDLDADGDALTLRSVTTPAHGTAAVEEGQVRYTPNAGYSGSDTFDYVVADETDLEDTATVIVAVANVNDAPVANNDAADIVEDEWGYIDVLANDTDADGDSLWVTRAMGASHGDLTAEGDRVRYTPDFNYFGSDQFLYIVTDGVAEDTGTVEVTVTPVNDWPIPQPDSATLAEDGTILVDVLANDIDPDGDSLMAGYTTYFPDGFIGPGHGTAVWENNRVRYTPNPGFSGQDSLRYWVTDRAGVPAHVAGELFITVTAVNDAPNAVNDFVGVLEDDSITVAVVMNDSDPDGDPLTLHAFMPASNGTVSQVDEALRYVPDPNWNGTDYFDYVISDPSGLLDTAQVRVSVAAVNDPPVAGEDLAYVDEDSSVVIDIGANDSDVEDGVAGLTYAVITPPTYGSLSAIGPTVTYTPKPDYFGSDGFSYRITDSEGASATAAVTVVVNGLPDAPRASPDTVSTAEDTPLTFDPRVNDVEVDGHPLVIVGAFDAMGGLPGTLSFTETSVTFEPFLNVNGTVSFAYVVGNGEAVDTAEVVVTITPVNDPPVAANDSASGPEDTLLEIDVLANDVDPDGDLVDATLRTLTLPQVPGASISIVDGDGVTPPSVRYNPAPNYYGTDSWSYEVSDGEDADTATVSVVITPVNDAPVAVNDGGTLDEDTWLDHDVLLNDSDVDGDSLWIARFTQGANGSVTEEGDQLRYTPDSDWNGTDSYQYTITDGVLEDSATVTYIVYPVNDAPSTTPDTVAVDKNGSVLIDVLGNDSDVDGDLLSVSGFTSSTYGSVVQEGDQLRYTPDADFVGPDRFAYEASDGNGGLTTDTVHVTVQDPLDPDLWMSADIQSGGAGAWVMRMWLPAGNYSFETSLYVAEYDTYLEVVEDDLWQAVVAADDDSGAGLYSLATASGVPAGKYLMRVYSDAYPFSFHLEVRQVP